MSGLQVDLFLNDDELRDDIAFSTTVTKYPGRYRFGQYGGQGVSSRAVLPGRGIGVSRLWTLPLST